MNFRLPDFSFLYEYNGLSLDLIIWSLFVGVVLASIGIYYSKHVLGSLVNKLLDEKALSPESARTLEEIGFGKRPLIRFSLRKKSTFRKTVFSEDEKHYYIPLEKAEHAAFRYDRKGNTLFGIVMTVLIFAVVALLTSAFLPPILEWMQKAVSR